MKRILLAAAALGTLAIAAPAAAQGYGQWQSINARQANLDRIRQLCKTDCAEARKLAMAIAQAPSGPQTAAATPPVQKNSGFAAE